MYRGELSKSLNAITTSCSGSLSQVAFHLHNGDRTATVTLTTHKTLGTWKSAARDQTKQADVLQDKSDEYARTIMASPITRVDNWTSYHAIYLPRMTFVLPTSYLSDKCLHNIEKRAVAATL
jgi:hypothetical protein